MSDMDNLHIDNLYNKIEELTKCTERLKIAIGEAAEAMRFHNRTRPFFASFDIWLKKYRNDIPERLDKE